MKKNKIISLSLIFVSAVFSSCNQGGTDNNTSADFEKQLQERFRNAKKGDVIDIPEGKFEFTRALSLESVPFVTIRGAAQSKTLLLFKNQEDDTDAGGIRILNSNDLVIENLSIHATRGDGIKIQDSKNISIRNIAVGWEDVPKDTNGSYGIYLLACKNILIEKCAITASSVAGIYVGQSENVIVRNNLTYENIAGIQIENCIYADVHNNKSYNNAGGICIFNVPEFQQQNGHHVRIYENVIRDNNFPCIAPKENTVAMVPSGTGILLMSARHVEIFKNEFSNHHTVSTAIISFLLTKKPYNDSLYNPFSSSIFIHHNKYEQPMAMPDTACLLGKLTARIFGENTPHILFDGFIDTAFVEKSGNIRESGNLCLKYNGDIKFANMNAPSGFKDIQTNPNVHDCEQGELPSVER